MDHLDRAVNDRPFPQTLFMSEVAFASFLRDRGLNVGVTGIRALVNEGVIQRLGHSTGDFHSFQLWPISQFNEGISISLIPAISYFGLNVANLQQFVNKQWPRLEEQLRGFSQSVVCREFDQILPLLLWLESYFLPVVRSPRPGVINFAGFDFDGWEKWRQSVNLSDWLDEHGVAEAQLSAWRQGVLHNALKYDPAQDWYLLIRSIPFERRTEARGSLRLAYDLYEIAEIVRMFLERVSEKLVTKEWDPRGHPAAAWANRFYGVSAIRPGATDLVRSLIRRFGLDPTPRVLWLVEGPTELSFIHEYARGLGIPADLYVEFRDFGGDGAFQKKLQVINQDLVSAAARQQFVTVAFDSTPKAHERVQELLRQKLINLKFGISNPDFEGENFTIEELLKVASQWAREYGVILPSVESCLALQVNDRLNSKYEPTTKAVNSVIHLNGLAWHIEKGDEWGRRLARHMLSKREEEVKSGTYDESNLNKIETQVLFILQASQPDIDYQLSIEHTDFNKLQL